MNEAKEYRRAFAIGLLTLGVALGGQVATSLPARTVSVHRRTLPSRILYAEAAAQPSASCLAGRVARVVIGAVLKSFA